MSTVRHTRRAGVDDWWPTTCPGWPACCATGRPAPGQNRLWPGHGRRTEAARRHRRPDAAQPVELAATFLPAHAVPVEYRDDTEGYVQRVIEEMLPAGARWMSERGVRLFCDVFCEEGRSTSIRLGAFWRRRRRWAIA